MKNSQISLYPLCSDISKQGILNVIFITLGEVLEVLDLVIGSTLESINNRVAFISSQMPLMNISKKSYQVHIEQY
jgi:hypothetical protein